MDIENPAVLDYDIAIGDDVEEITELDVFDDLTHSMGMLSLKLREQHIIPSVSTDELCITIKEMLINFVERSFQLQGLNVNVNAGERCATMVDMIQNACGKVSSQHKLEQYCATHLNMVRPVEILLGRSENGKKQSMQYIPVMDTIKLILDNEDIVSHILQHDTHRHGSDILCNYSDGDLFNNNPYFSSVNTDVKLRLHFYMDEFGIVNPLGSKQCEQKLTAVYFTIGNIHAKYRSKLENIYLCLLVRHKYIQSGICNYSDIFRQLVRDLNVLRNDGLIVTFQGRHLCFKGTMVTMSADNLSAHDIGGFQKHFSAGCVCRVCMTRKEDLSTKLSEDDCVLRSKDVHKYHLDAIENDASNAPIYGVRGDSALSAIDSFHVIECLPPDIMHDCLEGVFIWTTQVVLNALIADNEVPLTINNINTAILDLRYGQNDKSNKPSKITRLMLNKGITGKASAKFCLFRLLPQMVGHNVPVGNSDWKMYLLCREIADYVMAPVFRRA